MLTDYYHVKKCICGYGTVMCGGDPSEDDDPVCSECHNNYEYIEIHKCTDPDKIIVAAEAELEDANYHSLGSLPSSLFKAILPLVSDKLKLAWAIANTMPS